MQETIFMAGLGHNIADIMEGIRRVEDLSKPRLSDVAGTMNTPDIRGVITAPIGCVGIMKVIA